MLVSKNWKSKHWCSIHTSRGPLRMLIMNSLLSPVHLTGGGWPWRKASMLSNLWKICGKKGHSVYQLDTRTLISTISLINWHFEGLPELTEYKWVGKIMGNERAKPVVSSPIFPSSCLPRLTILHGFSPDEHHKSVLWLSTTCLAKLEKVYVQTGVFITW